MLRTIIAITFTLTATSLPARAAEICGNGVDDDADSLADEGCAPSLVSGVCESPLSCEDTGMVSPLKGALHYSLPPDISPRVPFGPGIGFRRFYLSQYEANNGPPSFQAAGTQAAGTGAVTPSWPTHQANDIALLIVETAGGEAASLSTAQGFTAVTGGTFGDNVDTGGSRLTLFWKRATSSSESAPTVADAGDHTLAQIVTFRGVIKTGDPWDVVGGNGTSGTAENGFTIPQVTTTTARTLLVNIVSANGMANPLHLDIQWNSGAVVATAETSAGNDGEFSVATQNALAAGVTTQATGVFWNVHFDIEAAQRQARIAIALKADPTEHKPMGDRWAHTYMSWLHKWTDPSPDQVVLHTNRGQDVVFTYDSTASGWDKYVPQAGFKDKFQWIKQRTTSPFEFQARTLTGETIVYNSVGRMTEVWDTLATPNKVLIAYDSNNMVSTVTDASGKRRLLFGYTNDLLTSVAYQLYISAAWSTQHTTSYSYTSGNLTSVTIGGELAQSNTYSSNYLTAIDDGAGNNIATFSYDSSTAGKVVRVDTPRGMVGFEYNSSRTSCSGKTVLHFNRGNTSTCSVDSDCGSGFLCGGKTGTGSTGVCFRGARCMTVSSPNEDLVTSITALGPPSETCDGTCLDVAQYIWNTGVVKPSAVQDPSLNYTTSGYNSNGLPTRINYGDTDSTWENSPGTNTRAVYITYDATYPGRVDEVRHQTSPQMLTGGTCPESGTPTTYCAVTNYDYNTNGKLERITQSGNTLSLSGAATYTSQTTFAYDSKGRLTEIALEAGDFAKTTFGYITGTGDPLKDDFLEYVRRYKDTLTYLTEKTPTYDFRGNPTSALDPNDVVTCFEFDTARGYLKTVRRTMAGQSDCSTTNSADLTTSYVRDSALRLTKVTRPDGSCMHFEYDTKGRLSKTKRRDDCNATSSGDREEYTYSPDSLLTKVETFDSSGTVTKRQEMTYFDSRRLEKLINPVDTSKFTSLVYDSFGLVSEVNGGGNLNKTAFERAGTEPRVTTERRYRDATSSDAWTLLYDWLGLQRSVTDGDSKVTLSDRDDLGRRVKLTNPDLGGYPTLHIYDVANRLTDVREASGGSGQQTHSFTYDRLGRVLTAQYHGSCPSSAGNAEIQYTYDSPPVTCPVSGSCLRTSGRLAYVKVTLMCDSAKADKTLDQETWFSYDDAGRVIREHIRDDNSRIADMTYEWTKNGALSKTTTPTGNVLGATFGSAGSNSDTDRITALWRTSTSTPVIDNILWNAYGPLKQYNQMNTVGGGLQRTRITRNLAYRITQLRVEKQDGTSPNHTVDISEDAAGRVIARDYDPNANGVEDSYFIYDHQDRVLCERTTFGSSCPTDGTNSKNSHSQSPPFTAAGDWKRDLRPIAGSSCMINDFTLNTGTHQIATVSQTTGVPASPTCSPAYGTTEIGHDSRGNRSYDDNTSTLTNDRRDYTYDARRNVINVRGQYYTAGSWHTYDVASAFDERNRRVFKSFLNNTTGKLATWFFSYDANDRLVQVVYTPDTSASSTYSVFQLFWLQQRLVLYWQIDYPSASSSRRYVGTDESERPIDMWGWPASGDGSRVWAVNPRAWGMDTNGVGPTVYQPTLFAGQYQDVETAAMVDSTGTLHRPGVVLNGYRTYDPFSGSYLQVDRLIDISRSSYVYAQSDPVGKEDSDGRLARMRMCTKRGREVTTFELDEEGNPVATIGIEVSESCEWIGGDSPSDGAGWGDGSGSGPTGPAGPSGTSTSRCPFFFDIVCRLQEMVDGIVVPQPTAPGTPTSVKGIFCTATLLAKEQHDCSKCTTDCALEMSVLTEECIAANCPSTGSTFSPCNQCDKCTIPGRCQMGFSPAYEY